MIKMNPLYVEQHMRHDTLRTKTRITEFCEGILILDGLNYVTTYVWEMFTFRSEQTVERTAKLTF